MGITSVKIIGKYAASGVNYAKKRIIILATDVNVLMLIFLHCCR
jgi:hypothetical protein